MQKPNIVFILIDDMGWRDLGCYGSSFYETPRIDALAKEGMTFSEAYAAAPVCSPTRASILSGKYPARVGVTQFIGGHNTGRLCDVPYFYQLPASEYSLPQALRDNGYRTWHVGKWHLGGTHATPDQRGFDVNIAGSDWGRPKKGHFSPYQMPNLKDGPPGEFLTDRLTDEAITLLDSARGAKEPFFLNMSHYAVHAPIQAPEALVEKYRLKAQKLGLDKIEPFETGEEFTFDHDGLRQVKRRTLQSSPEYGAMVENLDTNIGRLVDTLKKNGQWENTILVFTSDNGGLSTAEGSPTCNAPLAEGKGWMYEGGNREPLVVVWPGHIAAGSRSDAVVTSPDFYPSLLDAAGLPLIPEQHADGKSFLPALSGKPYERGPVFWHYPHYSNQGGLPGCAMREGDWKLIEFFEDHRIELYNLKEDISEKHNLAATHPEVAARLLQKLKDWQKSVSALIPQPNVNWGRKPARSGNGVSRR